MSNLNSKIVEHKLNLKLYGYTIIPNVYSKEEVDEYWVDFNKWRTNVPELDELHLKID